MIHGISMRMVKFWIGTCALISASLSSGLLAAEGEEAPRVTFEDHVKPVLREHCFTCHNQNEKKGGLALDTYASTIEGGAGGEVVYDGDSGSSRLWQLMAHEDTPVMPPGQDKLPDAKITVVADWINGGLLENSGSKAKAKKSNALAFSMSADGRPDGPAAMPETVWKQPVVVTERTAAVTAITASPWAPLVAIAGQNQVVLYNTDTSKLVGILPFPEGEPQSLSFSRDGGYLLVGGGRHSYQGITVLYDIRSGNRVARAGDELDIVLGSDINDMLTKVALGGPKRMVRIHDVGTGEQLFELKKHTDWVFSVRFSPDGILVASGDRAGGLVLWEADTGRLYLDLVGHKDAIRGIAWRADSNVVASASMDGTVKMWDIHSGNQVKSINAHGSGVTGIDMARDGRMVSCGKDRVVKLWDANGNAIRDFPAMPEAALEVSFSHDGSNVIAGDWSGQIRMWKTDDPTQVVDLTSNPPTIEARLQAARAAAEAAQTTLQQHTTTLASLTVQLAAANSTLASMNEHLMAAKNTVQSTETTLAGANTTAQQTSGTLAAVQQNQAAAATRVAETTKAATELAAKRDALLQKVKELEQATNAAIAARDGAANSMQGLDQQIAALQAAGNAPAEQLADLQGKRSAAAAEHDAQAKVLDTNSQQLAAATSELKTVVEAIQPAITADGQAQKEVSTLQANVAVARQSADSAAEALRVANSSFEAAKTELTKLEAQLPATQQAVTELTTKRDESQVLVQQATAPRDSLEAEVAQLEADLDSFSNARQTLVATETELQVKLEAATAEAEAKLAAATEVAESLTAEDQRLKTLQEQLAALQSQVDQLKASKNELESAQSEAVEVAETTEAEKQKVADRRALYEAAYGND